MQLRLGLFLLLLLPIISMAVDIDFSGKLGWDGRLFHKIPLYEHQGRHSASLLFAPDFKYYPEASSDMFSLSLFGRLDASDSERSHYDIRALNYLKVAEDGAWEASFGIGQVFWGVTESQNLVNIINQTDTREGLITTAKLGQPLVSFTWLENKAFKPDSDWGALSFYIMPLFRTAGFPGKTGRLRPDTAIKIDNNNAVYEHERKARHLDYALRYTHSINAIDIGLSYFKGTNRLPSFYGKLEKMSLPMGIGSIIAPNGEVLPYYAQIEQIGIDTQWALGNFLLKLEAIRRRGNDNYFISTDTGREVDQQAIELCRDTVATLQRKCNFKNVIRDNSFTAYTLGLEYSMGNFGGADFILVSEYNHDSRGNLAFNLLQDDLMLGTRIALNNTASTTARIGLIRDLTNRTLISSIELSSRLSNNVSIELESRSFLKVGSDDRMLWQVRNDDYTQLAVLYYF